MRYGLRFIMGGKTVCLMQISGGGRILLADNTGKWWTPPPSSAAWEIYETNEGQTYPTREAAESAAINLTRTGGGE